jgi:hypothetical protein
MKEHKIIKYNLQDEVKQLQSQGMAYQEIASTLKSNHPEIPDLSNLSAMAIQRYIKQKNENEVIEGVEQGKNPVSDFIVEYRQSMKDIIDKTDSLYEESMAILESVKQTEDNVLKMQAVSTAIRNLDLMRKNHESLVQNSNSKINTINNVNLKKEIHVKNLLVGFTSNLCPSCKLRIAELLEKEVE